ncbi:hypothetical protein Tco_1176000 [Tanacetum coccineum]
MSLIELSQVTIPFPGHLKEYGYDKIEVMKELEKLQVDSTKSTTCLRRFLKEKSRIEEEIKATIDTHCFAILEDALPPKEKDLGSFSIPCKINDMCFDKALADLGASVSDYSTFTNVCIDVIDFAVVENMDAYRDKDTGDIIVGKPFCRNALVEARRFDIFLTIGDGNDSVIYQITRSHPRFKHLSNKQCNKIRPLLKVSARDKLNGILHPYQKLKDFYKGVLNLGTEYVKDGKKVEWLTRGHMSIHEMDSS